MTLGSVLLAARQRVNGDWRKADDCSQRSRDEPFLLVPRRMWPSSLGHAHTHTSTVHHYDTMFILLWRFVEETSPRDDPQPHKLHVCACVCVCGDFCRPLQTFQNLCSSQTTLENVKCFFANHVIHENCLCSA